MDDTPPNQAPGENFNKLDLTALEAFQFGTQWTDASGGKKGPGTGGGEHSRGPGGDAGPSRRDRRPARRPNEGESSPQSDAPRGPSSFSGAPQREGGGQRPGGREGGGRFEQRPRFERGPGGPGGAGFERGGGGGGGQRFERGGGEQRFERGGDPRDRGPRRPMGPPRPYISPIFEVTFYPDDQGFNALVKAMRASCRTYELFEIARLILAKVERCVVVFRRRTESPATTGVLYISVPDGIPFETEDQAIGHALEHSLDQFFTTETVEVEAPKGSFQFVNRCPVTKDLLGPPNYHRYAQIVQHHFTARGINMPFERYKASIEVVRDPEAIAAWLESMKKVTRYTYKAAAEGETTVFDNLEDARAFLLRSCRDKLVRASETARLTAKAVEAVQRSEAFEAMHGTLETQRRFPLDTANALRGRLRRENFHIFKRGSKGVTYVCSVRRKFRQIGQTFSESINRLIEFLEKNPLLPVSELSPKFLGFSPPSAPAPATAQVAAPAAAEGAAPAAAPVEAPAAAPAPENTLTAEQKSSLNRLILDLRWLVSEGYVAEYSDGKLFVQPVLAQGQAEPDEKDHDTAQAKSEEHAGETASEVAPESPSEIAPAPAAVEEPPSAPVASEPAPETISQVPAESLPVPEAPAPAAESAPESQV